MFCQIVILTKCSLKMRLHYKFDFQNAVLALDDSALDIDQVENLIKFCPTKEEMELLKVNKQSFNFFFVVLFLFWVSVYVHIRFSY